MTKSWDDLMKLLAKGCPQDFVASRNRRARMQLVERTIIKRTDPRYAAIDRAAFASKNLYNAALYEIRQSFIHSGKYISYNQMDKIMQKHEAYRALPRKVSQQVLKLLDKNWQSFFAALLAHN